MPEAASPPQDPAAQVPPRQLLSLLGCAAIVGVVVSVAAFCFLEAVHWTTEWVSDDLPDALGFDGVPVWWPLPVLFIAGLIVAFAILRLPGRGGHVPALGLNTSPTAPIELPGVMLAALGGLGLGVVLGPEAPLLALGGGLGILAIQLVRRDAPPQLVTVLAASGSLAALSFIFESPVIAAVIIIEAAGIGGPQMTMLLLARADGGRNRIAPLAGPGIVDRRRHERLRPWIADPAASRPAGHRGLRLDHPVGDRHRRGRISDQAHRAVAPAAGPVTRGRAAAAGGPGGRRPGDRLLAAGGQAGGSGALLR